MATFAGQWGPHPFIDGEGDAVPNAVVTVRNLDATLATLYTGRTKAAPLLNPLPLGVSGGAPGLDDEANGTFYADPGPYTLTVTVGGVEVFAGPITVPVDPAEALADGTAVALVEAEAAARAAADDAEAAARASAVTAEAVARAAAVSAEAASRIAGDSTEATARAAADTTESTARVAGDAANAAAATAALTAAQAAQAEVDTYPAPGDIATNEDLLGKADLVTGKVPEAQLPDLVASAQPLLRRIKRGVEDATMLVIGDSTADWVALFAALFAGDWPTHTFNLHAWSTGSTAYAAPTVVQTGSGARTVDIYRASSGGWRTLTVLAPNFDTMVKAIPAPDVIVVALGHNEAAVTADARERYLALTESLTAAWPLAEIIVVAQNPNQTDDEQAERAAVYEQIAAARGYGFIDVHQAFADVGDFSIHMDDTVHPDASGYALWAAEVHRHFQLRRASATRTRPPSSLLEPSENLLDNGHFGAFIGALPDKWTGANVTATKDTVDYRSPNGYSIVLSAVAPGNAAYISQSLPLAFVRNSWVTIAALVKVAAGKPYSAGNVGLKDSAGESKSLGHASYGRDGWRWEIVSRFFGPTVTSPVVRLYADSASGSADGTGEARFDCAIVARGMLPRDLPLDLDNPLPTVAAPTLYLPAGSFGLNAGSPALGAAGLMSAFLMDAASVERIAAAFVLDTEWSTFHVDLDWTNIGAGSGDVSWSAVYQHRNAGTALGSAQTTLLATTAFTAPAQTVSARTRLASDVAVGGGALKSIRLAREASDAGDTLANDAGVLGILLTRAS